MTHEATIAGIMVTRINTVPLVPAIVEWRREDVLREDEVSAVIISGPVVNPDTAMEGGVRHGGGVDTLYLWTVSVYSPEIPEDVQNQATIDDRPEFMKGIKNVLALSTVPGMSGTDWAVWDFRLVSNSTWENKHHRDGVQVSRFGIGYKVSERQID